MTYYLGVDIGTTATKCVAFSSQGGIVAIETYGYDMYHPQPGWMEQNPDEILNAVVKGINSVAAKIDGQPAFVCFSSAMHGLIAVDAAGDLLTQCITWADNRADDIANELKLTDKGRHFYRRTGVPIHSMSPFCKLLWFKKHDPKMFTEAYKLLGIKEYIFYKLFNRYLTDTSIASATGLLNLQQLNWDEEILDYVGISKKLLPEVVSPKFTITDRPLLLLELPEGTPFVIGASDGAASNLGTGASGGELTITVGTSSAARRIVEGSLIDNDMRTFCYHVKDNQFITGGASNNGAVVMQWLKDDILHSELSYDELYAIVNDVPAGSDGLTFLPYLMGERAPIWNGDATGLFFGLTMQHSQKHLIRASVEAIVYCIYSIGRVLDEHKKITAIYAAGGFAKSPEGLQVMADMFGVPVHVSSSVESSALGAVIVGLEALGLPANIPQQIAAAYQPNLAHYDTYQKGFARFQRLYELLKEEMERV